MAYNLSSLPNHGSPPHLQSFPSSKTIKKFESFNFKVDILFVCPIKKVKEGLRLPSNILAKPLFTNSIILEICLSLMKANILKINKVQFVDILLATPY
jgi:hypothetical protein